MPGDDWIEFGAERGIARAAQIAFISAGGFGILGPFIALGALVGILLFKRFAPKPRLSVARGAIRSGRRVMTFESLNDATLEVERLHGSRSLRLHVGVRKSTHVVIPLRFEDVVVLTDSQRSLALEMLRSSSIEMPPDPYDTTGRFARYNYPTNVTREQAIALLESPPLPSEALPIV